MICIKERSDTNSLWQLKRDGPHLRQCDPSLLLLPSFIPRAAPDGGNLTVTLGKVGVKQVETFSVKSRPKPYVLNVQENHVSSEEQMVSDIRTIFIILYVYFKVT